MKMRDLNKERSEEKLSIADFLKSYNENLPAEFPRASLSFLKEFKEAYPGLFKNDDAWYLGKHRKKFMDWHPQRTKILP